MSVETHYIDPVFPMASSRTFDTPIGLIVTGKCIGNGNFGTVFIGFLSQNTEDAKVVAVKVPRSNDPLQCEAFAKELDVMKSAGQHTNIVNLFVGLTGTNPMISVEYCKYGSLVNVLKTFRIQLSGTEAHDSDFELPRALTVGDLYAWSFQAARGMEHLAAKNIVHRDLAARNVLVDDNLVAKIADFGLARGTAYYTPSLTPGTEIRLPIAWMAPECFLGAMESTRYSERWSFGVLLWEIFTFATSAPYNGHARDLTALLSFLREGHRLPRPEQFSSHSMWSLMNDCWNIDPHARPTFSACAARIQRMQENPSFEIPPETSQSAIPESEPQNIASRNTAVTLLRQKLTHGNDDGIQNFQPMCTDMFEMPFESTYVAPSLVKQKKVKNTKTSRSAKEDRFLATDNRIRSNEALLNNLFERKTPQAMIIIGDPGQGKTTFLRKLALDWALAQSQKQPNKLLEEIALLFAFPLRNLNFKATYMTDILWHYFGIIKSEDIDAIEDYMHENPMKILIVLDGLDELNPAFPCEELSAILDEHKGYVKHLPLILTTRPYGVHNDVSKKNSHARFHHKSVRA